MHVSQYTKPSCRVVRFLKVEENAYAEFASAIACRMYVSSLVRYSIVKWLLENRIERHIITCYVLNIALVLR